MYIRSVVVDIGNMYEMQQYQCYAQTYWPSAK